MRLATTLLLCLLLASNAAVAQKKTPPNPLQQRYGPNYEEVIAKFGDRPDKLLKAEREYMAMKNAPAFFFGRNEDSPYIARTENEPNDFFDTADDIDDVLAMTGWRDGEFNGALIEATFTEGDYDVFKFTVDTTKMYYFGGSHSYPGDVNTDSDGLNASLRLFHESDLDTTWVENFNGIQGNDQTRGDLLGRSTDHRANSGDSRLTGWVSPIDPATGEKLTGTFYLFFFNGEGGASNPIKSLNQTGTYHFGAYAIDLEPWVSKAEPNQTFQQALANPASVLPPDAVVRTYMGFNPDTIKIVECPPGICVPTQGNDAYPQLLAQGDEDIDVFQLPGAKANHTLVIETMPYFGWYREPDGSIGPGNTRWTDMRVRLFNADYTTRYADSDDDARETQTTNGEPNNVHSRIVYDVQDADVGGPLWVAASAWASTTRDPEQSVDNRDPGRFMYDIYVYQYSNDLAEASFEPDNDEAAGAMGIPTRQDTVISGSFASAGDVDYFRVFAHEQRMYTFFTRNSTVSSDIEVEIYHEYESDNAGGTALTGNLLTEPVAGNAGDNDFLISGWMPEESGAYLIKLTSSSAGDYQLGAVDKGQVFYGRVANEPDDELSDAQQREALEVGPGAAARTAMIFPAGDVDHYYFNADAGFELMLTAGPSQPIVDDFEVEMTLLGPGGGVIETSNTGIARTLTEAGQYVVQVTAASDGDVGFYTLSGGQPFEETEANNSFATANLITLGNIYEASLTAGDVDYFMFTLEAGKLYSFRSLDNGTGGPLTVEFFDQADGQTLLDGSEWFNNYDGDNFKIANIVPRTTRTYYLKISGNPGPYKVVSRINEDFLALKDKAEPNNNMEEADATGDYQSFGADVEYVLFDESNPPRWFGDEDWFRVSLSAGQTLRAETKPVEGPGGPDFWNKDTDTRLVIFASDATTELANDDDGGNEWYSLASHTATEDGVVYVVVRTSRAPGDADDRSLNRGDYLLNLSVNAEEAEPNNTFAEADGNVLAPGFVNATFEEGDLTDIYKLSLEADHIYHVRTLRTEGGYEGAFTARLYKAGDTGTNLLDEENMGYNSRYSGDNVKLNIIPDETGDYYLMLDAEGAGAYQVGLKGRDITALKEAGEPNNTLADADVIGPVAFDKPGQVNTYMLYNAAYPWSEGDPMSTRYGDDVDLYRVELNPGDTLVAQTSPVDGSLWTRDFDGYMQLLAPDSSIVAEDDDGAEDWHSRIEYIAEAGGTFYVLVRSQDYGEATDRDPSRGEYDLSIMKRDGSAVTIDTEDDLDVPEAYELAGNYPNPFNPTTNITYKLPAAGQVSLAVYNVLGQKVATLVDQVQGAGAYTVQFNALTLSSGVYLYRLEAGNYVSTKKMLLVK